MVIYLIAKGKYEKVCHGMSYRDVVSILGANGNEISSNRIEGVPGVMDSIETKMYSWANGDGSNMNAMFQNDKLMSKAQLGLR